MFSRQGILLSLFLASADLTAAIKNVLEGNNVRCAVAFLGSGVETLLGHTAMERPRIICDVTLGGTSPNALRALGAPENGQLRHFPSLHAKIYASERGAVVGSANASENGIGFNGRPGHLEAGILLQPSEDAFRQIEVWFEEQWTKSKAVDETAIDLAAKRFRPERAPARKAARQGSLLALIAADPDRFSEVSIVIVGNQTPPEVAKEIRKGVKEKHPDAGIDIATVPVGSIFSNWPKEDLNRWRRTFIELWMPKERLSVFGRKVAYYHEPKGAIIGLSDWKYVRQIIGGDLPTEKQIREADGKMVRHLLDTHGKRLYSASELALEIEKLPTSVWS